jgi:hypothetical protein
VTSTPVGDHLLTSLRLNPETASGQDLRLAFGERLPEVMLEEYRLQKSWKVRTRCVRLSTGYSRRSEAAVTLGKIALFDRSKVVRYRAVELLACSLRQDALPELNRALGLQTDAKTRSDLLAAIDAIENRNHTYFWDTEHDGKWIVNFEAAELK